MPDAPSRLARRLGVFDAVVIGLGSMIGAGVFVAFGPAARAAGNGLLIALLLAGVLAYCNATSSAQLAALYPRSGGTYVYGRERLGEFWGFIAGFGFVIGKLASSTAMAIAFSSYAAPGLERPVAVGAVSLLVALNLFGIEKSAALTRVIVVLVLGTIGTVVVAITTASDVDASRLWPITSATPRGILEAMGFLFFAFAGYARLATLGEEVVDPKRTIRRAVPIALGIALAVYACVAVSLLVALPSDAIARSAAPLVTALESGGRMTLVPVVRAGAAIASLGVLLSLLLGLSRTVFAMATNADLPRFFAHVDERYRVPRRAEAGVGAVVVCAVAVTDLRAAIGFSSFAILVYYAIANACALTLSPAERGGPRWIPALGFAGCAVVAVSLPLPSVAAGAVLFAAGALAWRIARAARA